MDQAKLIDILNDHADALNAGVDETEAILGAHANDGATLRPLLNLARQIKASLVPLAPPAPFVAELGAALKAGIPAPLPLPPAPNLAPPRRLALPVAAAVGSLLSLMGLIVVLRRRQRGVTALPA